MGAECLSQLAVPSTSYECPEVADELRGRVVQPVPPIRGLVRVRKLDVGCCPRLARRRDSPRRDRRAHVQVRAVQLHLCNERATRIERAFPAWEPVTLDATTCSIAEPPPPVYALGHIFVGIHGRGRLL